MNQIILSGKIANLFEYTTKDGKKRYFIFDLLSEDSAKPIQLRCYIESTAEVAERIRSATESGAVVTVLGSITMKTKENVYIYSINAKHLLL
jgi:hypothetical protein